MPNELLGPYVERSRADWAELAEHMPIPLDEATLEKVRGLGDPTSMLDVREVYLPDPAAESLLPPHQRAARFDERIPPPVGETYAIRHRKGRLRSESRPRHASSGSCWPSGRNIPGSVW